MPFHARPWFESLDADVQRSLSLNGVCFGSHPETDDHLYIPNTDRYAGSYILGVQGSGKSGLLQNLIHADMLAGQAVIVIDPHGDLVKDCINHIPQSRLGDTYLLDMEDEAYPFGVNLFSFGKTTTDVAKTQAVQRIMHIFDVLWPEVMTQQNLPRYLLASTLAFMANPGTTLVDMHPFLQDQLFRNRLLANVTDISVRRFWADQYDSLGPHEQYRRVQPLIGRLEALFMGRSLVRNIVGQRRNTISFRNVIEKRQIVFIKLPMKTVAQDARLIGIMLLAQINSATFSFANVPENQRPGYSLYVDEFQHLATSDFAELLTEGRKFGVRVTVAHQYRNQLPAFLRDSTMTARTKVCFQTTPEDGREMAHLFPSSDSTIKPEDMTEHASRELLAHTPDIEGVQAFVELYLRPLQGHKRGAGRVEIEMRGSAPSLYEVMQGGRSENPRVADPTPYLDALLHQVMVTGNTDIDIPPEVVRGFANCGGGFFKAARKLHHGSKQLTTQVEYPASLIIQKSNGSYEPIRPPEGQTERMYYFICCLRLVMQYLACNPIGKATGASSADVAKMLTALPKRAAFVHSGDTVGVIYTHDTMPKLGRIELFSRARDILEHTRMVYCHPKVEVERSFMQPAQPATSLQPVSRWEEVE